MKYIYVMGSHNPDQKNHNMTSLITNQTGDFLYSLIEGLRQKDFGLHTLTNVALKIREYAQRYLLTDSNSLYADSGGYSILTGTVPLQSIIRFIKCYNKYVFYEHEIYDFIFSLDIAFSKGYDEINTKSNIYYFNNESLLDLRNMLDENPMLAEKIFFVWHFKMQSQYEIFQKLYKDLELHRFINNRAIGGMVSMRGTIRKHYSPFTAMAFRCLRDFLSAGRLDSPFRIHFLGMYIPYDRFHIAFLEKLFQRYLADITDVLLSYDSINFEHTARLDKQQPIFHLNEGLDLDCYKKAAFVPSWIISGVYTDPKINEFIQNEIERRQSGHRLINSSSFGPLSVHSNLCLDNFFENVIDEYELVDLFFKTKSPTALESRLKSILADLANKYGNIFKPTMIKSIEDNMDITFTYHRWFLNNQDDDEALDYYIKSFIHMMGFPDLLR